MILAIILGCSYAAISINFILKKVIHVFENVEENKLYTKKTACECKKMFLKNILESMKVFTWGFSMLFEFLVNYSRMVKVKVQI